MKDRLMFVYMGDIYEKNSLSMLTLLENEMADDSYGIAGRKRLFMFVLESLQNVSKHSDHDHYRDMSVVIYGKSDDGYSITTGNVIDTSHVSDLRERLEKINHLSHPGEIKTYYREVLSRSEFSTKGGAGLGLIEMAVRTGNRLNYDFVPLDENFSYFILNKSVDSTGQDLRVKKGKSFSSRRIMQLKDLMAGKKINMIWSGHISPGIGDEVLSITETKLSEDDIKTDMRRRTFGVMVEILENVTKYSPGRGAEAEFGMPVAIIRCKKDDFVLTTGNLINTSGIVSLKEKLDMINKSGRKGLKQLFIDSLKSQTIDTDSTGIMGLIAVSWKSGSRLRYSFEPVNDNFSFYTLTVEIKEKIS